MYLYTYPKDNLINPFKWYRFKLGVTSYFALPYSRYDA